ncbi:hypothetical protein Lal_00016067 [Lupinus albus]|uniref:Putative soluble epoxide hydrolase n=1 Tax=Lupinus albus TaxID=3870 RepID=A0A6A4QJC0_LUPAL|nr:putative soluble epoxide hydrolase [Lupinus albus]KAF1872960.1 hypothetical protein Lal_00016067 [Lupinus albus]
MDQIQHKFVEVDSLNLHIADIGTGPKVVVFLHGFPEIWYSWRYQMFAVAEAGLRAIAPDYRGYGLSDSPPHPRNANFSYLLSDLLGILDALSLSKVFLVGKDFGARVAHLFSIMHPERVLGVVTLGVPYVPPGPSKYDKYFPEGFYMLRWRRPERAEADFGRFDMKTVVKNIYILFSGSELAIANENQEIMDLVEPTTPLPPWLTEEDLAEYGALYEKSGFQTALQIPYRSFDEKFELPDPVLKVPSLLIMGGKDYILKFPGFEDLTKGEKAKQFATNLEITYIPEGTHFVQEQYPAQVNHLILAFLAKHT